VTPNGQNAGTEGSPGGVSCPGRTDHAFDRCGYGPVVRDGEWVRFVIRFEIVDLDRFREMASAMVAVSRDEPGTLVYDWYVDEPANQGTLYEAYASREALQAHGRGAVFTEVAPRYLDALRVISVDAFGEAADLSRRDMLGAPTTWWGAPIAAVTTAG
jgi:quinol monooxygenase YgiN